MYLGTKELEPILRENGYDEYDHIYISCEQNSSKRTGTLFKKIQGDLKIPPERILHIGDNWQCDILNARDAGFWAMFYPKTIECISYGISDIKTTHAISAYNGQNNSLINLEKGLSYLGNRCAIAMAANRLYDMPFYSYNEWSEVNASPQFAGTLALGLHLLGLAKWISENASKKGYDNLVFIARDGYLPMKAYEELAKHIEIPSIKVNYFYTSRKAALLCAIKKCDDLYSLYDTLNAQKLTGKELIKIFAPILTDINIISIKATELNKEITSFKEYCNFINCTIKNFLMKKRQLLIIKQ